MTDLIQLAIFLSSIILLTPFLGRYMAKVFLGERNALSPVMRGFETFLYKLSGIDQDKQMSWKTYTLNLLIFNLLGFIFLFLLLLFQQYLPLNPQHYPGLSWHLALNTAISFVTNTNWQSYSGESTLSYLVQMAGLTVQNFVSAGTGIAVLIAVMRGLSNRSSSQLGNFWVDLSRSVLYVLLPLSIVLAILLSGQGVIQNFSPYQKAITLEGKQQLIPAGPVASQIAIKQLGTNGGGYFGTNSAHPFENPTPFSNFLQVLAILLIPASLTFTYGRFAGSNRQGWTLFITMMLLFLIGLGLSYYSETRINPLTGIAGNMEGKETRVGVFNSILWSVSTSCASNGSVNAMMDSLSPLSGMIALFNIMLGEVIFGGVGAGLYGMVIFILLTVFIAGLMVGRTPEYLGKKVEAFEIKMSILAILAPCIIILLFSAFAAVTPWGLDSTGNKGPHGLSQILYAFSSAAGNNGSAFAGLTTDTPFFNISLGFAMIIGRFGIILPVLAIAGSMSAKKKTPPSKGTFRTDNWLFIILLIAVILIVGGLTFFPALALGPIADHLLIGSGISF